VLKLVLRRLSKLGERFLFNNAKEFSSSSKP